MLIYSYINMYMCTKNQWSGKRIIWLNSLYTVYIKKLLIIDMAFEYRLLNLTIFNRTLCIWNSTEKLSFFFYRIFTLELCRVNM